MRKWKKQKKKIKISNDHKWCKSNNKMNCPSRFCLNNKMTDKYIIHIWTNDEHIYIYTHNQNIFIWAKIKMKHCKYNEEYC